MWTNLNVRVKARIYEHWCQKLFLNIERPIEYLWGSRSKIDRQTQCPSAALEGSRIPRCEGSKFIKNQ